MSIIDLDPETTSNKGGKNLVVFDIDGTLVRYHRKRNDLAYVHAVKETFGITVRDSWSDYLSSTDSGILCEIIEKNLRRPCSPADISGFKKNMAAWLDIDYGGEPFESMPGAKECLTQLADSPLWCAAIATGNWEFSGCYKLRSAGFDFKDIPFASADDGSSREIILKSAFLKAGQKSGITGFKKAVYVGDWTWDVKAAAALGWDFIGIASGDEKKAIMDAGARHVLPDFNGLIQLLDRV